MYTQCFICRGWSHLVSKSHGGVRLCLPCYVDVLEVRAARGVMGEPVVDMIAEATSPGNSPSPVHSEQLDIFDVCELVDSYYPD